MLGLRGEEPGAAPGVNLVGELYRRPVFAGHAKRMTSFASRAVLGTAAGGEKNDPNRKHSNSHFYSFPGRH